jgi:hypothetical protein
MKAIKKTGITVIALFSVFSMGFTEPPLPNHEPQSPVEIKVTGNPKKQPVFLLKLNDAEAAEYQVRVKDENGELLYSEVLKAKNISRKYQLGSNDEELNEVFHVQFEIIKVKTNEKYIYNVSRKSKAMQEIVVAKL